MRPTRFAPILVLFLARAALAQFTIDAKALEDARAEVVPAIEAATGTTFGDTIRFELADRATIEAALREEFRPQFRIQFPDPEVARAESERAAGLLASAAMGKYAPGTKRLLVCPPNFESLADLLDEPGLLTREGFLAVVVHECVHAADDLRYDWPKTLATRSTKDELLAFNAVLEGHAQHVARRVCQAKGWTEGFETLTRSIGKVPDTGDETRSFLLRIAIADLAAAYYDGERFFDVLLEKGGPGEVDRAFREPPLDTEVILRPEWFLDPASRPRVEKDLEGALRHFASTIGEEWPANYVTLTSAQLRAAIGLLDEETSSRILAAHRQNRMVVLQKGGVMIACGLFEFESSDEAAHYLAAGARLNRIKDESMKEGQVQIVDSTYQDVSRAGWQGEFVVKTMETGGQRLQLSSVLARRGSICLEWLDLTGARTVEEAAAIVDDVWAHAVREEE